MGVRAAEGWRVNRDGRAETDQSGGGVSRGRKNATSQRVDTASNRVMNEVETVCSPVMSTEGSSGRGKRYLARYIS